MAVPANWRPLAHGRRLHCKAKGSLRAASQGIPPLTGEGGELPGFYLGNLPGSMHDPDFTHNFIKRVPARAADRGRDLRPQHLSFVPPFGRAWVENGQRFSIPARLTSCRLTCERLCWELSTPRQQSRFRNPKPLAATNG